MTFNVSDSNQLLCREMERLIQEAIPDSRATVTGAGGHFQIAVEAAAFAGKSVVDQHRMVYGAVTHLMSGAEAPVHAIDSLKITVPA